jgi:hypothetical protein
MNAFQDLFRKVDRPVGNTFPPDRRGEFFPDTVDRSRQLRLHKCGEPIPTTGAYLLIGVATWSDYDMKLLDLIDNLPRSGVRIELFDSDQFKSIAEIEALIPGINVMAQTPFVGYWVHGVLTEVAAGALGRRLIAKVCKIDPAELDRSVLTRPQLA